MVINDKKRTVFLVLLIKLEMTASLSDPINSVPVSERRDQRSWIFGERMESELVD